MSKIIADRAQLPLWVVAVCMLMLGCSRQSTEPETPSRGPVHVYNYEPSWSRISNKILYVHNPQTTTELQLGGSQIWMCDLNTGQKTFCTNGIQPEWSHDDRSFTFTRARAVYRFDLTQMTEQLLITCGTWNQSASTSPDGTALVYDSDCRGGDVLYLWVMDLASGQSRCLVPPDQDSWRSGVWSPDGLRLAHTRYNRTVDCLELFVMDTTGTNALQLHHETIGNDAELMWSHDGQWIYWTTSSADTNIAGLWRVHPDGTSKAFIIPGANYVSNSPMDTTLIFMKYDNATNSDDIYFSKPDGTEIRRVFPPGESGPRTVARHGSAVDLSGTGLAAAWERYPRPRRLK